MSVRREEFLHVCYKIIVGVKNARDKMHNKFLQNIYITLQKPLSYENISAPIPQPNRPVQEQRGIKKGNQGWRDKDRGQSSLKSSIPIQGKKENSLLERKAPKNKE